VPAEQFESLEKANLEVLQALVDKICWDLGSENLVLKPDPKHSIIYT
jgi:hypothetical protein